MDSAIATCFGCYDILENILGYTDYESSLSLVSINRSTYISKVVYKKHIYGLMIKKILVEMNMSGKDGGNSLVKVLLKNGCIEEGYRVCHLIWKTFRKHTTTTFDEHIVFDILKYIIELPVSLNPGSTIIYDHLLDVCAAAPMCSRCLFCMGTF